VDEELVVEGLEQPAEEQVVEESVTTESFAGAVAEESNRDEQGRFTAAPVPGSASQDAAPEAAPVVGSAAPTAPAAPSQDWMQQLGAVDLSALPPGAGMPMTQVAELHKQLIAAQRQAAQHEQTAQQFRQMFGQPQQQTQAPQMPAWYPQQGQQAPQQSQWNDPELAEIFGDAPQQGQPGWSPPQAFVQDWQSQQSTISQLQQEVQQIRSYYGQMQQQQVISDISARFPDVPADSINLALASGIDVNAFAASMQAHINGIRNSAMKPQARTGQPPALSVVPSAPAAPRPAHVPGSAPVKGADVLSKQFPNADPDDLLTAKIMMDVDNMTLADIKQYQPQLWRSLSARKVG